jgi:regulator of cell morphogenesis and NO signaling
MTAVITTADANSYRLFREETTMAIETAVATERPENRAWEKESLTSLIAFILETHHVYTRAAITNLPPLAAKVRSRHGSAHPETGVVARLVQQLLEDLAPHLDKEERVLFPYILALEAAAGSGEEPESCFGTVRNPIQMMMREHDAVEEILGELRAVTVDYTFPPEACDSFQALYAGLKELEADLRRHIHLENDVLFPGAVALEGRLRP